MNPIFDAIGSAISAVVEPVADVFKAREERKTALETAKAKIQMQKQDSSYKLELTDQEWEALSVNKSDTTWKDEYITLSVVGIFNLIVLGALLQAFGHPQVLIGIKDAISALKDAGVDLAFIINATVLAGIGLKIWRR